MSNCCACTFEIELSSYDETHSFLEELEKDMNEDNDMLILGTKERPLYDFFVTYNSKIYIHCWVDWAVEHEDMIAFVDCIKKFHGKVYHIKSIKVSYKELMDDVIGNYFFDGKTLKDRFLTQKQIADIYDKSDYSKEEYQDDEIALNDYHKALYKELDENPTMNIVKIY